MFLSLGGAKPDKNRIPFGRRNSVRRGRRPCGRTHSAPRASSDALAPPSLGPRAAPGTFGNAVAPRSVAASPRAPAHAWPRPREAGADV